MVVNVCHHDFLGQGIHLGLEWSRLFGFSQPRGSDPACVIFYSPPNAGGLGRRGTSRP